MISGVPISEVSWQTWWMLLSIGAALVGLIGWQLVQMVVGMFAIARRKKEDPKFSSLEEQVLPGRIANRPFRNFVLQRTSGTVLGQFFFYLMIAGAIIHVAFWVYAVNFMKAGQL